MSRWSLSPATGATVGELKESLNQRLVDLDLILSELEQVEQQVKGQGGYTPTISNHLDMQGHRITGLAPRPQLGSDACSFAFHQTGDFLYSTSDTFRTDKRIEHAPGTENNNSVTLKQLLAILAEQFQQQIPPGIIVIWHGSVASIPPGWHLCDGTNGTEDLRDVFIPGAGAGYAVNAAGGADTLNLAHAHTADGTLAAANESSHTHGDGSYATDAVSAGTPAGTNSAPTFTGDPVAAASTNATPDLVVTTGTSTDVSPVTTATGTVSAPVFTGTPLGTHAHDVTGTSGTGSAHGHDVTGSTDSQLSATTENRPKYYAKAYIQKL